MAIPARLGQQSFGENADEDFQQIFGAVRHGDACSITKIEPQGKIEQRDQPPADRRSMFVGGLGIDLRQDFQAASRRSEHANHLPCAQIMAMIGENSRSILAAQWMRAGSRHQGLSLSGCETLRSDRHAAPFRNRQMRHANSASASSAGSSSASGVDETRRS